MTMIKRLVENDKKKEKKMEKQRFALRASSGKKESALGKTKGQSKYKHDI